MTLRWLNLVGILLATACADGTPVEVQADPTVTGTWTGAFQGTLTMTLDLIEDADGSVRGSGSLAPRLNLDEALGVVSGTHSLPNLTLELNPFPMCAFCPVTRWVYTATVTDSLMTGAIEGGSLVHEPLALSR